MVIVKLKGGLGNQMFQYAAARSLVENSKNIVLDPSFFSENSGDSDIFTVRNFELEIFNNIQSTLITPALRKRIFSKNFFIKVRNAITFFHPRVYLYEDLKFQEIPHYPTLYLEGYFQSEKYFKNIRPELLKEFQFPILDDSDPNCKCLERINATENSVSIHIRRGDYLKPEVKNYHGVLEDEYYEKAVRIMEDGYENLHFFVFSDDVLFAKEKFSDTHIFTVIEGNSSDNSWKDMFLMSQCKHHILANSSFSWWGSWLSEKEGMKIGPKNWLNPKVVDFDIETLLPENYFKI